MSRYYIEIANGTGWILRKLGAMKMCLDKWGLYIEHLGHDNWISLKMEIGKNVIMLAMFIELLEILFYHLLSKSKN